MPTVKECFEQAKFLIDHGKGEEKAVLVLPRVENRRKQKNPQKRVVFMCDDDLAARYYAQRDRWFEILAKSVAMDVMVSLWERMSDEQIGEFGEGNAQA